MAKTEKEQTAPASAAGEAGVSGQAKPQLVKVRVTRTGTNISRLPGILTDRSRNDEPLTINY